MDIFNLLDEASHPTLHQPQGGKEKKTIIPWNKHGETVYTVYSWMLYWGQKVTETSVRSTVRPVHPSGAEGRVTKFASQIARQSALGWSKTKTDHWSWSELTKWIVFFLVLVVCYSRRFSVVTSLLFLSHRFQNMYTVYFRICILYTSHFTHLAFVFYWLYWAVWFYCDLIRVWSRCFCFFKAQHFISTSDTTSSRKHDSRWSWQTYQFLCSINHCFCFLHQNGAFLVVFTDMGCLSKVPRSRSRNMNFKISTPQLQRRSWV